MASDATEGYGSTLGYAATGGGPFTDIAQTKDLPMPEPEVGDVNITNNDSPDNTKEYIPGMIEPGEFEFDVIYKKSVCAAVYALLGTPYFWKETFPDGSSWAFPGYLKKLAGESETEDGTIMNTFTIKVTGKPTFAAGGS